MTRQRDLFAKRIRQIKRQHAKLSQGFALKVDKNNLIVPRAPVFQLAFPWKGLFVALCVALSFKAYLMATFDAQTYASKLDAMAQGHPVEQVGAWIMQPDPASDAMARMMRLMQG